MADNLPLLSFGTVADWSTWLDARHADAAGVWLRLAKRGNPEASVSYAEALDVALCYGWIDGRKGALDELWWRQRFTPRRASSRWSVANRTRAETLLAEGRMTPAGLAEVERARADGRWAAAYAGASTITVPADLQAALDADPVAAAFFTGLDGTNRYAVLYRIQDARTAETRARRIGEFVTMLRAGRTLHPPRRKRPTVD